LAEALRGAGKVSVIEDTAVDNFLRDRMGPANVPKKEFGARKLLEEGTAAYRNLKLEEAVRKLAKAKVAFRNNLAEEGAFEGLRASQFYLAMSYLARKERTQAREELLQALTLDPERRTRKLSDKLYSTEVRKLFEESRKEVSAKARGDLEISTPSGGELVYVDGKSAGAAPVRIQDLPIGEHFIRVEAEGKEPYFASQTVVSGENRIVADLKSHRKIDPEKYFSPVKSSSEIEQDRASFLDEMGLALGADIFVLLSPGTGQVSAQLYDQRSQEVSPIEKDKTPSGLARKLLSHLDRDGYVTGAAAAAAQSMPVSKPDAAPAASLPANLKPDAESRLSDQPQQTLTVPRTGRIDRKAWYENPWIWGGLALGLGAAAASVLLFTNVGKKSATTDTVSVTVPGK
jgi:tetratricopeptide (TPR) repeat protein